MVELYWYILCICTSRSRPCTLQGVCFPNDSTFSAFKSNWVREWWVISMRRRQSLRVSNPTSAAWASWKQYNVDQVFCLLPPYTAEDILSKNCWWWRRSKPPIIVMAVIRIMHWVSITEEAGTTYSARYGGWCGQFSSDPHISHSFPAKDTQSIS